MTTIRLIQGESPGALCVLDDNSVDSIVTDPPYGLSFMGKKWDYDVPSVDVWRECLRVLKPGGYLLAFAGTRTQHRMAVRIEDAGFEIRDMIAWIYGSGFPKSLDVSKAIDKMDASEEQTRRRYRFTEWVRSTGVTTRQIDEATGTNMGGHYATAASQPAIMTREHLEACRHLFGVVPEWVEREADIRSVESANMAARAVVGHRDQGFAPGTNDVFGEFSGDTRITAPATDLARQWQGWGTALKPALEPLTVARKPLIGTVAQNVTTWGTGAINVDGGRVPGAPPSVPQPSFNSPTGKIYSMKTGEGRNGEMSQAVGRFPANLIHDGSDEVVGLFPVTGASTARARHNNPSENIAMAGANLGHVSYGHDDNGGSASRFFYCAKASRHDREDGCAHLEAKSAGEVTGGREEGSAGLDSPRAGAGRGTGSRNHHPTVKPTELMRYLCRLVTPPGGVILDPFMGSGSTGRGAVLEGFQFIGIEREADYIEIARARIAAVTPEEPQEDALPATGQIPLF